MILMSRFSRAAAIVDGLEASQRRRLESACRRIQKAQQAVLLNGAVYLEYCGRVCRGLCCRNLRVDEIVSLYDFILVLASAPQMADLIAGCARAARGLHNADCVFLKDGRGPCLFPEDLKPERCIASFCFNTRLIRRELSCLRTSFTRLVLLVRWWSLLRLGRRCRVDSGGLSRLEG